MGTGNDSEAMLPIVYDRLRNFAKFRLCDGHSMFATDLVHEGYLRVSGSRVWDSQTHFLGAVRNAMRNAVVDHLRKKNSQKRGGGWNQIELDRLDSESNADLSQVVALSDALDRLAIHHNRAANVVTLKFFACMSDTEISTELDVSTRTVSREWAFAKAWLKLELSERSLNSTLTG